MMPPLPTYLLFLLMLQLAAGASTSAASFTCAKPSTCHPAIGYVVPNATTYEKLISRFRPATLHDLLAANQLPADTAAQQAVPARTTLRIPFRCFCTGHGVGQSNLYTVKMGGGNDDLEILTANNILTAEYNDKLIYADRLPCSCDKVNGSDVMHFAYIVRNGDKILEIAARYGLPESMLLRINNITIHSCLRQGQILDIPLQGMGTSSTVQYISGYRRRSLGEAKLPDGLKNFFNGIGEKFTKGSFTNHRALGIFVGVIVGLLCVGLLVSLFYGTWYYWISAVRSLSSWTTNGVMQFNYSSLARATHKFSEESKIGEGYYGTVYKGTYDGEEVAVKKIKEVEGKTVDLHDELQAISNTKHKNLVRLKGWCGKTRLIDGTSCWKRIKVELLLVFEFIPNGSLEDHLYKREQVLSWEKRYKIVKGVGSAVRYLHHECNPCILHRDIKPGNILLDDHCNAKLADFGLSLITSKKTATALALSGGAKGYMDPQLQKNGELEHNRKSDVYSFGILLLEIACMVAIDIHGKNKGGNPGKKSREEIWELYNCSAEPQVEAAADPKLGGVFDRKQMERVVVLGLKCSQPEETQRPSMEYAMKFLEDRHDLPTTTQGEVGYSASCSVNGEEEAPMMPPGAGSSC